MFLVRYSILFFTPCRNLFFAIQLYPHYGCGFSDPFGESWMYESVIGFEPMNTSFAEKPLKPLGYTDISRPDNKFPIHLIAEMA